MGIKVFSFIARRPGTSPEEFHSYWRDVHAAHIAAQPDWARYLRRYELNHRMGEDHGRDRAPGEMEGLEFDGVAVWWLDSLEDFQTLTSNPEFLAWAEADAPKFRDARYATVITEDESVIVDSSKRHQAGLKLSCILHRNPDLDLDTFHHHWLNNHGGLFQNVAELRDPLWGYHQNHGIGGPDADYDGVTEQWFEGLGPWLESLTVAAHHDQVEPDVAYLLDPTKLHFVLSGQPTVVIGD